MYFPLEHGKSRIYKKPSFRLIKDKGSKPKGEKDKSVSLRFMNLRGETIARIPPSKKTTEKTNRS